MSCDLVRIKREVYFLNCCLEEGLKERDDVWKYLSFADSVGNLCKLGLLVMGVEFCEKGRDENLIVRFREKLGGYENFFYEKYM